MTKKSNSNNTAVNVRLINAKGQSSLVEYVDGEIRRRVYVPSISVKDGQVSAEDLNRGIPYGYPLEEIEFTVGGAGLAEALHKMNLWTIEDVLKSPQKLRSALQATIASQLSGILQIAHGEKKGVNDGNTR